MSDDADLSMMRLVAFLVSLVLTGGVHASFAGEPGNQGGASSTAQTGSGAVKTRGLRPRPDLSRLFPPTVPNGAVACAKDQGDPQGTAGRDLSGFMFTDAAMTNAKCRTECATRGFVFSGTQVGDYCFCGNSYGKSGLATNCATRCSGNAGEICGGIWANSVSLTGFVPTTPSPPANGGQCVIDIQGQLDNGQIKATYRQIEIQQWVVSTTPMQVGAKKIYPVQWTTIGSGEKHEDNLVGTKIDWAWNISGARATQLEAQKIASTGNWLIQLVGTAMPSGVLGTQLQTVTGTPPQQPVQIDVLANAFGYPSIAASGTLTQIAESKQFAVPANYNWGISRPAYATGTVRCQWNLTLVP